MVDEETYVDFYTRVSQKTGIPRRQVEATLSKRGSGPDFWAPTFEEACEYINKVWKLKK